MTKILAGVLLGLALGVGCSGLFALASSSMAPPVRAQLAMWIVLPVWLGVLSGVFAFDSGLRAWLWLGAANVVVWGTFIVPRVL